MSHNQRKKLKQGVYTVVIDSELKNGHLTYADLVIPGKSKKEVLLSTYICHPSMANNELSGPAVNTYIGKWLMQSDRKYTYRIVFIPETIGSLVYLGKHLKHLKENVIAGFVLSCIGDDRMYSWMPSRTGATYADKIAKRVLDKKYPNFKTFSYLTRGSDERQYCSPGIDLPVASLFRSKYDAYPEYHTSLDNLDFVTPSGLNGGFNLVKDCIKEIEKNSLYQTTCLGEPQLGKRGLYAEVSTKNTYSSVIDMINLLAYADGTNDLPEICKLVKSTPKKLLPLVKKLSAANLIDIMD
jgi:aminopeptidase-like protein